MPPVPSAAPIAVGQIASGDRGALQTLNTMRALVNASLTDPLIIEAARSIVRMLPPRDYDGHAGAVRAYLQEHFQFVQDPNGVEMLSTPRYLLTQVNRRYFVQGDCDDAAILGAALAKAIGLRARFVIVAFFTPAAPFTHVFTIVKGASSGWRDLDTTRAARYRGTSPTVTRNFEMEV